MYTPYVFELIDREKKRQDSVINLIASENVVSEDVRLALGSVLVNKYAEGYPGKRYYAGNGVVDEIEELARARALELFALDSDKWSVNVQPLSGTPANLAVYSALVPRGERIMALELAHGGHLSHGYSVSFTGKLWEQVPYGVSRKNEKIDYEEIRALAKEKKPTLIVVGYTAYPRAIDFAQFRDIADSVGAHLHVDMSHIAGLVAGGAHVSPFEFADTVMTTTHKTLRGPRGAMIFSKKDLAKKIDKAVFPGLQGGPHMHTIAAIAVALGEALDPGFLDYIARVVANARVLADELSRHGIRIVSGGTDTHIVLVDVWNNGEGVGGKEVEQRLEEKGIVVNKNTIPFDTRAPQDPSGIRLGTAAETTRGKTEEDFRGIAKRIAETIV